MRLIDVQRFLDDDAAFFKEVYDNDRTSYAIVSHRWGNEEITFQDAQELASRPDLKQRKGYRKIKGACEQCRTANLRYAWIDTCCIDKSSSSELQEAINSMFHWYASAVVCYTYLNDVQYGRSPGHSHGLKPHSTQDFRKIFLQSTWFTRSWTLQELLASQRLVFYSASWEEIGSLQELLYDVSSITRVDVEVLLHRVPLASVSIAKRMSWAAGRETTRVEDFAYSLFGIFDVNMPMLYGEREKAFIRLQEEIIKSSTDESIFAWMRDLNDDTGASALFARKPSNFTMECSHVPHYWRGVPNTFQMTNNGLHISTFLYSCKSGQHELAILNCKDISRETSSDMELRKRTACALVLRRVNGNGAVGSGDRFFVDNSICQECGADGDRLRMVDPSTIATSEKTSIVISRDWAPKESYEGPRKVGKGLLAIWVKIELSTRLTIVGASPTYPWTHETSSQPLFRRARSLCIRVSDMKYDGFIDSALFFRAIVHLQDADADFIHLVVEVFRHGEDDYLVSFGFASSEILQQTKTNVSLSRYGKLTKETKCREPACTATSSAQSADSKIQVIKQLGAHVGEVLVLTIRRPYQETGSWLNMLWPGSSEFYARLPGFQGESQLSTAFVDYDFTNLRQRPCWSYEVYTKGLTITAGPAEDADHSYLGLDLTKQVVV